MFQIHTNYKIFSQDVDNPVSGTVYAPARIVTFPYNTLRISHVHDKPTPAPIQLL